MLSTTALSRRIHSARNGRVLLNLAVVPVLGLVLAFSACGSSSSNSSDTPSSSPTTSSQASSTKAECSSQAILSALPGGATMQEFTCAKVGDTEWAAARVSPGDTVFFLRWNGTKWNAEDSQSICGTASAGLPQSLLSYCKAAPVLVADDAGHRGLHVRGDSCRAPGQRHDGEVHLRRRRWQVVGRCAC